MINMAGSSYDHCISATSKLLGQLSGLMTIMLVTVVGIVDTGFIPQSGENAWQD